MIKKILKAGRQKLWTIHRDYLIDKHELKYLFWECTLNCNFKCKHCGSCAGSNRIAETLLAEDAKKVFFDVANKYDSSKITIAVTGGEPLMRQDLFEVMTYASSLGFRWGMVTNGSLVSEQIAEKMKNSGMKTIDVSIDGLESVHDEFRNYRGSYQKAIDVVKILSSKNFLKPLRITTTVHRKNINQLEEMYDTFSKTGAHNWRLLNVDPIGRGIDNNEILLNKIEVTKLLDFIKKKRTEKSKLGVSFGCAHFLGDEYEDEIRSSFFYCATGNNIGSILHNGDIFVCPNVPRVKELIQGNVKKDSFTEVWENKFDFFKNKKRMSCEMCQKCDSWEECLGGSLHSWNFEKKKPKICYMDKDFYVK
jgi:radical SAM protein with 4Fe4S-binding SPASM domain